MEVGNTRFSSVCLLKILFSICKKQIYAWRIVRIFEVSRYPIKSFETVNTAKNIQAIFTNFWI